MISRKKISVLIYSSRKELDLHQEKAHVFLVEIKLFLESYFFLVEMLVPPLIFINFQN